MNKKLFAIILVSVFLLSAISFVSAEETSDSGNSPSHSISVKINWNDTNHTNARPDSVTITLMKDGEIIATKTLNESNSWSTTFEITEDGNFSVNQVTNLSNYSVSINNSSKNEIVITNTFNNSASGEPQEGEPTENTNTIATIVIEESGADTNGSSNGTNPTNNTTDNNSTKNNTTNSTTNNTTNDTNITNNTTQVPEKKDEKPIELIKVGIPIIVLILAILIAVVMLKSGK